MDRVVLATQGPQGVGPSGEEAILIGGVEQSELATTGPQGRGDEPGTTVVDHSDARRPAGQAVVCWVDGQQPLSRERVGQR
jgi:hypothetical protein